MSKPAYKLIKTSIPVNPEEWCLLEEPQIHRSAADRFPELATHALTIGAVKIQGVGYYFTFDHQQRLLCKRMDHQSISDPVLIASKLAGTYRSSTGQKASATREGHWQSREPSETSPTLNIESMTTEAPTPPKPRLQFVSEEKKAYYDARMKMKSKGVYIPAKGPPYEIECHVDDVPALLNCHDAGQSSCPNLELHGYKLCMFSNCSGPVNKLATLIEQRQTVDGDVILMDDVKDLMLKDLDTILTFCKGHRTYQREKCRQAIINEIQRLQKEQSTETEKIWADFKEGTINRLKLRLLQC